VWQNVTMASLKSLHQVLAELRAQGSVRSRRSPRLIEAAPLIARLLAPCKTVDIEERATGLAFRLQGQTENATEFSILCVLRNPVARTLTAAENAVADLLCEGRTLAQIAHLRGVSANTVKSQVRQIFRKLNVESRVALVRKWCA
jgi:DNA-binding NarL/FixJ family response regulator